MDLALLATLKDKLVHAQNFTQVMEYFFDHFGEDPAFIALGDRAHDPFLEAVLREVGKQLFGGKVAVTDLLLTRLPEHQFLHGGCALNGKLANFLYFEDIHVGLLAVAMAVPVGEVKMVRFTGRRLPPVGEPSQN
jgi:hypothetical protein